MQRVFRGSVRLYHWCFIDHRCILSAFASLQSAASVPALLVPYTASSREDSLRSEGTTGVHGAQMTSLDSR